MDYHRIRESLKTGDILLFRAGTTRAGQVVGWVSQSPFSHVAMVVRYQGELCIWESGRHDLEDVIHDRRIRGVHLARLDGVLDAYTKKWEGDFVLRRLQPDLGDEHQEELERWLPGLSGRPFPELWEIARDQIEALFNPVKFNRESYSCAELIADTYQRLSLVAPDRGAESYSPRDFSMSGRLPLQFGYTLSDALLVTYTKPTSADKSFMPADGGSVIVLPAS